MALREPAAGVGLKEITPAMNTQVPISRRDLLKLGVAAPVAAAALAAPAPSDSSTTIPVTVRDALFRSIGKDDCWSAFRELGADGIEVNVAIDMSLVGMFHPTVKYNLATPEGIAAFKRDADARRVSLLTFMMANRFDSRLDDEIAWMKRLVAACKPLGVRTIRIDLIPEKHAKDEFLPFAIKTGKQISAIAAEEGVRLAIENHGNTTNDPGFLEKLFDSVGAANLGLTLEAANFYWYGHPLEEVYGIFHKFAARAFHAHCKSIKYPEAVKNVRREMGWKYGEHACPIYDGDIDFVRFVRILREANYTGDLCLENESLHHFPKDQHVGVLKKEIAHLRRIA